MKKTCSNCGSVYKLESFKISSLEKDTIKCEVCPNIIFSYNEGKNWTATLIEKHENHLK